MENVYIVNIAVPEDIAGKRLDAVFLEFYVDVSLKEDIAFDHSPVIEVYPLEQAFDGENMPRYSVKPLLNLARARSASILNL